ncbi:hypothetical protein ACTMTU_21045 [Streptomyces sp. OZ13]|uniref:hypothetical protein n=1 Tax=Streptomyces sp. OZ13 TaxID=3452210 RepID=UPI003F89DC29
MTEPVHLRLLPWTGPEGKPCYLSTDDPRGYMSRLADSIESIQLGMAAEVLDHATTTLRDKHATPGHLRLLANELTSALADTLRVATSRRHPHTMNTPNRS